MNPLPYLRGAPLVEVRGVPEEELQSFRDRARALEKGIHLTWRVSLSVMLILVLPLVMGALDIGSYFIAIALLTLLTVAVTARMEYIAKIVRRASNSDQRWIFHGRTPAQPTDLLVPGWVTESPTGDLRPLDSRMLAWVDPRRARMAGKADTLESQELKYRHSKLVGHSALQVLGIVPLVIALAMAAGRWPLTWLQWLWAATLFLVGIEATRRGIAGLFAAWRLARDAETAPTVTFVSAAVPEMQGASGRIPELLGCLHGIEVLPSRLIWSVDGRPARWRVQNTTPTFAPKRLLVPRGQHRSIFARMRLLPRRARP